MNNLLVAQSGGPTAAINATLAGVLQGVRASGKIDKVYGAKNGIEGAIKDQLIDLNEIVRDTKAMDTLTYTPSSALGTCRYKMKDWRKDDEPYKKIIETFYKFEIMGRNAGWLTASAALARVNGGAGADLIYLCEKDFDNARFISDVKEKLAQKSGILVAVSEGCKDSTGAYISDQMSSGAVDNFGHKYIAGAARALEQLVRNEIGCKVRSIELNLMQRAAAHIASETDIIESLMLGQKALSCALAGETGRMAAIKRLSDEPYRVEFISVPVNEVANHEKTVPMNWITPDGHDVTEELIAYMKPLIQGETNVKYANGLPLQIKLY